MAAANQQDKQVLSAYCPVFQDAVELIGRRWTGAIVRTLLTGSTRFGEILARMSDDKVGGEEYDRAWPERARATLW